MKTYSVTGNICLDVCKFKTNVAGEIMIGSNTCKNCEHNKGDDIIKKTIDCTLYNKENEG